MEIHFFESIWHLVSLLGVFTVGLVFSLSRPFGLRSNNLNAIIYLWHTIFCVYFAWFALNNTADARGYYLRSLNLDRPFSLGTTAIDYFTSILTQGMGFSYLGTFLVYNIFGVIGLFAFLSALKEVTLFKDNFVRRSLPFLMFLPGINFWTSSIGKDSVSFFGVGIICWAALNMKTRYPYYAIGILIFLFVRPHIVGLLMFATIFALLLDTKLASKIRLLLLLILIPIGWGALQFSVGRVGIEDAFDLENINNFIEYRQSVNLSGSSSIDISQHNFFVRLIIYVFLPFFYDANGLLGLVASFENLVLFSLLMITIPRAMLVRSSLPNFPQWFFLSFSLFSWFIFANTTTNVGLALRHKWMFLPMLILYLVSYFPTQISYIKRRVHPE